MKHCKLQDILPAIQTQEGGKTSGIYLLAMDAQAYKVKILLIIQVLGSIVVSIPACHAGDRGSIPRRGGHYFSLYF